MPQRKGLFAKYQRLGHKEAYTSTILYQKYWFCLLSVTHALDQIHHMEDLQVKSSLDQIFFDIKIIVALFSCDTLQLPSY